MSGGGGGGAAPDAERELLEALARSVEDKSFVKATFSRPRAGTMRQALVRLVEIRGAPHLSFVLREATRDTTLNHPPAAGVDFARRLLREQFEGAHLFTTSADLELRPNNKGTPRLFRGRPTLTAAGPREHNRARRYVLDPARAPYLRELGLVGSGGRVIGDKAGKYRQLQHLVTLVDQLVEPLFARQADGEGLAAGRPLRVVDMGAGKGYLTFALYDYFNHHRGIEAEVVGVDRNEELVALCNRVAARCGYGRLRFVHGDVGSAALEPADVLVALHACDTATDEAIHRGVADGAALIVTVPCCQKELRPQFRAPPEEAAIFKHDTYKDRFAQILTDSLRGLLLESRGYRTRIMEFISDEHTHRNVLVAGVRQGPARVLPERLAEVAALAARYGVKRQRLWELLEGGAEEPAA